MSGPVFCFDAETNGLYGEVWAIGAVLLDGDGSFADVFGGQLDPAVVTDPWVIENVVPSVRLPKFESRDELLNAFWQFWAERPDGTVCVADIGAPVEAGLLRACVALDPGRTFEGPYPLHELGTALLMAGIDPDVDRREMAGRPDLDAHNPMHDALVSALCWRQVAP